jgi:hypothetical protein
MLRIFANIGNLILICNLILFIRDFRFQNKGFKIFTLYLGIIFSIQLGSKILVNLHYQNLYLSHFYFIGQFIMLSFFYKNLFKEALQKRMVNIGFVFCLLVLGIQYGLDPSLLFKFNLFEIFITSFLLIIYAAFHFYNMLNSKKEFYYINMGVLLYLFGSIVLFLAGNLMATLSPKINKIPWILNAILFIVYQIFIFVEWRKSNSKKIINAIL